jgi:PAS domain S-box-containing protein
MMSTRRKRTKGGRIVKGVSGKAPSRASGRVKSAFASEKEGKKSLILLRTASKRQKIAPQIIFSFSDYVREVGAVIREPLLVLNQNLEVLSANRPFYETFQVNPKETEGKLFYRIGNRQWNIPELKEKLKEILQKRTSFEDFELKQKFPPIGERTILVNARVISGQGKKPEFVLLVIRDVTENKKAEETIEQLSSFPTVNPMPIVETDIAGRVLYMNPAAKRLFPDLPKIGGRHPLLAGLSSAVNELKSGRKEWVLRQVEVDGAWYEQTIFMVEGGSRIRIYATDITENRQTQQALKESENKYRIVADNTYDWEFWSSPEGKYLYVSPSCKRITGYDPQEFLKDPDLHRRIIHPDDRSCFDDHLRKVEGRKAGEVEFRITRPDGTIRWIHHACQPVFDSGRNYLGPRGSNRDITDRKHKEEELRQLNRVLKALSDSSQAMMHATSESDYLKEVCNFIIKDCGYLMVWIGFAENDENKTVRPVAQAGFEKGYLETANITWADTERGRGPTGMAIRTGKPAICRNMLTDPNFKPWRKEALKRGYASSIVLPLTLDGKTFGAINIYSKEPDPFSEEEIKLLTELSNDLAYGIMTIKLRLEHEQTEATLAKSEEKYRFLYEEGQSFNIIIGSDQTIKDANKTALNLLGYEKDEVVGKPALEFIPDEEKERVKGILAETLSGGNSEEYEIPVLAKDGSVHLILFSPGQVTLMEERTITGIVVTGIDITERKQAEEALQESEERLNRAQEIAHLGSWELDLLNNRLTWSDEAYRIFGLKSQEFGATYEAFLEAVHPDDRRAVDAAYSSSLREGKDMYEIEHRVVRKADGEVRIVYEKCEHIRDGKGRIVRSVGMVQDITERKQAEESLELERRKLEAIIGNSPVGMALTDAKGGNVSSNEVFENIWGKPRPAARDISDYKKYKAWWIDSGKEVLPEEWASAQVLLTGEPVIGQEMQIECFDGKRKFIINSAAPIFDADGKMTGSIVAIVDITQRKQAEEQINKLNETLKSHSAELESSNQELEAFTYSVSHDLRAPLRSVEGFTRALLDDYAQILGERGQDYLKRMRGAADKMKQLIEDLLNLSRLARTEMKREETDLGALAQTIAGDLQKSQPERKVEFKIENKLVANVDRRLLEIALGNLLGNAWKFTSKQSEARIEFTTTEKNGETVYLVKDNGVGFDMTYANRLFIPFQRLHSTDEFPGTGIGLATVKRIIDRHGGRIWAEAGVEKGANFFFTLGYKNTPETNRFLIHSLSSGRKVENGGAK